MIYIFCYGKYNPEKPRIGKIAKTLEKIDDVKWIVSEGKSNKIIPLNSKNKIEYLLKSIKIRKYLSNDDILLGYMHIGALAGFLVNKGALWYEYPDPWKGWYYYNSVEDSIKWKIGRRTFYYIEKNLYKKAKAVTTASPAQQDFLINQHGVKENCEIILNCPDTNLFTPKNMDENLKEKFKDKKVLIHIGYIGREYGADILIKSLHLIKKEIKNVILIFLGSYIAKNFTPYLNNLIKKFKLRENVIFGRVPYYRVPHYLNIAEIGYIAFRDRYYNHMGGANKLFEYMACGLPVVSSRMWGFKLMVEEGKNIIFAKPEDEKDFYLKTVMLLQDEKLRKYISKNNIKITKKKYNWGFQEKKLLHIYKNISSEI